MIQTDAHRIARQVAGDLKQLYGERLKNVVLFGSWARGDAHPESDIDLLVVLDHVDDTWREHRRMRDILDRHSEENATVVCALIVGDREYATAQRPVLIRVRAEGLAVV